MVTSWHWYQYHFSMLDRGIEHPFATSIIDALLNVEVKMPGYAKKAVDTLASHHGRDRFLPHYDLLKQFLAELYVVNHLASIFPDARFLDEPTIGGSKKNPEITIETENYILGIEVKSPMLREHEEQRSTNPVQLPGRLEIAADLISDAGGKEYVTLPRDNPVKDFLISANDKFEQFQEKVENFYGILVIVWDDYIYEPITSLVAQHSGLLTENSFARDEDGSPLKFLNINSIIVIRHLHQIRRAAGDQPLIDGKLHALDFGQQGEFPYNVVLHPPDVKQIPEEVIRAFHAVELNERLGSEYRPQEYVMWI